MVCAPGYLFPRSGSARSVIETLRDKQASARFPAARRIVFRLAVIINLVVNLKPRSLFPASQVRHDLHHVADHFFPDPPNQCRTFRRNTNHNFAAIFPRTRPYNITEILQSSDQPARRCSRMPHFLRDRRHGQDFFLIQRCQKKKLGERDIARRQLFAKMQDKTTLHLKNNSRQLFRIGTELLHTIQGQLRGCNGGALQRA